MKNTISTPNAPKPIGPYSQAVKAGNFLFTSGQLAINPKTGELTGTITEQTKQVIQNLKAILQTSNYTIADVVQTTVYLSSMTLFEEFNREYAKHFTADNNYPARATVACNLKAGALIEISAVAYRE